MSDPHPPQLPDGTPQELRDFVACTRDSFTLASGPAGWLPIPGSIGLSPGSTPGTGNLTVTLGEGVFSTSFTLPVTIAGGRLSVDTTGVPGIPGAREALDGWTRDLNDWLLANGRRLKDTSIRDGAVTLTKEAIPATVTPAETPSTGPGGGAGTGSQPAGSRPSTGAAEGGGVPVPPAGGANPPGGAPRRAGCLAAIGLGLLGVIGVGAATGVIALPGATPAPPVRATATPSTQASGPSSTTSTTSAGPAATGTPAAVGSPSPGPAAQARISPIDAVFTQASFSTLYSSLVAPAGVALATRWSGPDCGSWESPGADPASLTWFHPHTGQGANGAGPGFVDCDATTDHRDRLIVLLAVSGEQVERPTPGALRVVGAARAFRCTYQGAATGVGPACAQRDLSPDDLRAIDAAAPLPGTRTITIDGSAWAAIDELLRRIP